MSKKYSSKYSSILKNYKAALKRAEAAGYKEEVSKATIPVKIGDRHDTLRLITAYRTFKRNVQRARNVRLADQRIQTFQINKLKKQIAQRERDNVKVKPPTGTAPGAQPQQPKKRRPGKRDYENIAFMNIQQVLEKAMNISKQPVSAKQQAYFDKVEVRAQELQEMLKELRFYDPELMDIYRGDIEKLYKIIQKDLEAYAWYDSTGMIDASDNLDQVKTLFRDILASKGQGSIKAQQLLNNVYGEVGAVAGTYS